MSLNSDTEGLFSFYVVSPKEVLPFSILTGRLYCPKCLLRNLPTKKRNYRIAPL